MNMSLWIVILLAVVQGLTEFFPVSSSGHLVIIEALFGTREGSAQAGLMFEIAVHLGTLGAVIVFYRAKLILLCRALIASIVSGRDGCERYRNELRYIGLVILGTIPAGIIGVLFHDEVEATFDSPGLSAAFLVATGSLSPHDEAPLRSGESRLAIGPHHRSGPGDRDTPRLFPERLDDRDGAAARRRIRRGGRVFVSPLDPRDPRGARADVS